MALRNLFCLLLLSPMLLSAEVKLNKEQEALSKEIALTVFSPFCAGRMLNDCPSSASKELKESIEQSIVDGKSRDEILDELYVVYGDDIRALPRPNAVGMSAWLAPLVFLLGGILILVLWSRSRFNAEEE